MIAAMRPDIDNVDEYVRNTTARAFAVVAQALGRALPRHELQRVYRCNPPHWCHAYV